jgi:hypothetical protein
VGRNDDWIKLLAVLLFAGVVVLTIVFVQIA